MGGPPLKSSLLAATLALLVLGAGGQATAAVTAASARPDLVVTRLSAPGNVRSGEVAIVRHQVRNRGLVRARGSTVGYYLATAAATRGRGLRLAARPVPSLVSGKAVRRSIPLVLPARLALGTYVILVCADVLNRVAERREANNCSSSRRLRLTAPRGPRTAPPAPVLSARPADPTNSTSARFAFAAAERGLTFECSLDSAAFAQCVSPITYGGLGEGGHVFAVRARNVFGLTSAPASFAWRIDITAPAVPHLLAHAADLSRSRSAAFTFSSAEPVGFECSLNGAPFGPCASPHTYADLAEGAHVFEVRGRDAAGNVGPPASFRWTVDVTPPHSPWFLSVPQDATRTRSAAFEFASVPGTTSSCRLDSAAFAPCVSPVGYPGPLAEGRHTFSVRAHDAAGNESAATSFSWAIDLTPPPAPALVSHPADPSNDASPVFSFAISEPGEHWLCRLDAGPYVGCSNPQLYRGPLGEGRHTFAVRARDAAGNESPETSFAWTLDLTPPRAPVLTGVLPDNPTGETGAVFRFNRAEAEPGVTIRCWLDGNPVEPCASPQTYTNLQDGEHTWEVSARDPAGNLSSRASHRWMIDTTPPPAAAFDMGVFVGGMNPTGVAAFGTWLRRPMTYALDYLGYETWAEIHSPIQIGAWRGRGYRMVYSVPLLPQSGATLALGATGAYEGHFRSLANRLVAEGQGNSVIRLGWEFNGFWYPWTAMNDPASFIAYWRRVVTAMRSVPGANFKFDWSTVFGPASMNADMAYPGDAYVDYIGMSVFDQDWYPGWEDPRLRWQNFIRLPYGLQWQRDFARAHGKQIAFDEWALSIRNDGHGGGDNPYYMDQIYRWFNARDRLSDGRPRVAYAVYFEQDKPDDLHRLQSGLFPLGAARARALWGS